MSSAPTEQAPASIEATSEPAHAIIDVPYLLAINVPVVRAADGSYHADASWAKDLIRHFAYLPQLTYLAPVERREPPADYVRLPFGAVRVVDYPANGSWPRFVAGLPRLLATLWREIGRTDVVHTAVAGYPVPVGWLAIPIAKARGKRVLVGIESAFWRLVPGQPASARQRLMSGAWERINRALMRRVDHAFYSHDQYHETLAALRALTSVTAQASWIDEEALLPIADIETRWAARIESGATPRFLFAGRMIGVKGTGVLLDAIDRLGADDADVAIDIIGSGPERETMVARTRSGWAADHVRVLDPVPYGPQFMALLTDYDAVLVPSLSDEQPRIVYDAYAQGVAVIASDVPGLRMCVRQEESGRLVPPADPRALADAIAAAGADRRRTRGWALAGRALAARFTHDRMHRDRAAVLSPFYPPKVP